MITLKHHILVKYNDTVKDKEILIPEIRSLFEKTLSIEGVHGVELKPNVIDRPNRYDLMIIIDMDKDALCSYDSSEAHRLWKEKYGKMLSSKAIFDSED